MLTKDLVIGLVSITELRQLQVRTDTVVRDNGVELARTYHRVVLSPGDDVTAQPQLIRDLAKYLWSAKVIAAYKASIPPPPPVGDAVRVRAPGD